MKRYKEKGKLRWIKYDFWSVLLKVILIIYIYIYMLKSVKEYLEMYIFFSLLIESVMTSLNISLSFIIWKNGLCRWRIRDYKLVVI